MENPYTVLEISKNASKEEIKKGYKIQALKWHPDRNKSPEAAEKFKEINSAYEYLCDESKKQFLDQHGRRMDDDDDAFSRASGQGGHPFGPGFPGFPGFPFGPGGMSGMPGMAGMNGNFMQFNMGHGGHGMQFNMGPNPQQIKEMKRKQLHIKLNVELTIEQIYSGIKKVVKYPRMRINKDKKIEEQCEYELNIKPGTHTNTQIQAENKGHILVDDDGSEIIGSIVVIVTETANKLYERDAKKPENLIVKQDITFIQALCGFELKLDHPSGKKLVFEYNGTIVQDKTYQLTNKGLPVLDRGKSFGDLLFKFNIIFPKEISFEQKEKLANAFDYKFGSENSSGVCLTDQPNIITGDLISHEESESEHDDEQQRQGGQSVQCAQS